MSKTPFIQLPFTVGGASGYLINPAFVSPMFPSVAESTAQAHWLFGNDNPTMLDMISGSAATCAGAVTQSAGYLTTPTTPVNNGINSGIADAVEQTWVMCFQERAPGSLDALIAAYGATATGKGCLLGSTSSAPWNGPFVTSGGSTPNASPAYPAGSSAGTWLFVAVVFTASGANHLTVWWGDGLSYPSAQQKALQGSQTIGFGGMINTDASGITAKATAIAEAIVFPYALTSSQLTGVYARSKSRLSARGITLF